MSTSTDNQVKKANIKSVLFSGKGRVAIIIVGLIIGITLSTAIYKLTRSTRIVEGKATNPVTDVKLPKSNTVTSAEEAKSRASAQNEAAKDALANNKPYIGDPINVLSQEKKESGNIYDAMPVSSDKQANSKASNTKQNDYPVNASADDINKYNNKKTAELSATINAAQQQNATKVANEIAVANGSQPAAVVQSAPNTQKKYLLVFADGTEQELNEQEYDEYVKGIKAMVLSVRGTVTDSQIDKVFKKQKIEQPTYKLVQFKLPDRFAVPDKDAAKQGGLATSDDKSGVKKGPLMVRGGEAFYATLKLGVNTDDGSNEVLGEIKSGRLKGSTIIGTITRGPQDMSFRFNTMFHPQLGKFGINAIAVSAENMERAMSDDINRHWFQRYGSIALSSVLEGISQAAILNAQTGKITTTTNGGFATTIIERDPLNTNTEMKIAAGKVGTALGAEVRSRNANVPDTFRAFPNKALGIYFLDSVYETDGQ